MNLSRLIRSMEAVQAVKGIGLPGGDDIDIRGIHYRAQAVNAGGIFFAIKGEKADGHDYIDVALRRGAAAVVSERVVPVPVPCIVAGNTRKALSSAAAAFFDHPSEEMVVVGITGTNGKTTTAFMVESIFREAGYATGLMGTICCRYAGQIVESPMTTLESLDLHRILADMRIKGVTHVVMEVSSHALALFRVDDCWMDVGVFTNLSRDHLDFHPDMTSYWEVKKRLFTELLQKGPKKNRAQSIFNCNDPRGRELFSRFPHSGIGVGFNPKNPIWTEINDLTLSGMRATIHTPGGAFSVKTPLAGLHNIENLLCAAAAGFALGIDPETIRKGLEAVQSVPGRFETITDPDGRYIIVDYAHTPDALENLLKAVLALKPRRIITIFGCGGNRDREKRPMMGEIAGRLSNFVIITSDNPRNEDPMGIIGQIREGVVRTCPDEVDPADVPGTIGKAFCIEPDRRAAIRVGLAIARAGDAVLIAGKGHESYQILGEKKIHFDDREEVKDALALKKAEQGHG